MMKNPNEPPNEPIPPPPIPPTPLQDKVEEVDLFSFWDDIGGEG